MNIVAFNPTELVDRICEVKGNTTVTYNESVVKQTGITDLSSAEIYSIVLSAFSDSTLVYCAAITPSCAVIEAQDLPVLIDNICEGIIESTGVEELSDFIEEDSGRVPDPSDLEDLGVEDVAVESNIMCEDVLNEHITTALQDVMHVVTGTFGSIKNNSLEYAL